MNIKKFVFNLIFAATVVALSFGFVACGGGDEQKTLYSINISVEDGICTLDGLPNEAYAGDDIGFGITMTNPDDSELVEIGVEYASGEYEKLLPGSDGRYSFTMPESPITVKIDARAYSEILSDGGVTFVSDNVTTFAVNSGNGGMWIGNEWVDDIWELDITLDWYQPSAFSDRSYAHSSRQDIIPDDAISIKEGDKGNNYYFNSASILINTRKITPGTTWLEIYLKSSNTTSDYGTVCIKITVTPEGTVEILEKWTQTVVFELEEGIDTQKLYFCFRDKDYADNTDGKESQYFYPGEYTIADNKVTLTIEYVKGHEYSISVGFMESGDSLVLYESVTNGGQYTDGSLTFDREGVTIEITVKNEIWKP